MYRSTAKGIIIVIAVITVILVGVSYIIDSTVMRILCLLIGGVSCIAVWTPFMLCPNCGKYLPKGNWYYSECPHCGEYLND